MSRFIYRFCLFFLLSAAALQAAHSQLLLVTAKDMNSIEGVLQRYARTGTLWHRVGEAIPVNLGRNGMGWGEGVLQLLHAPNTPLKLEGDGRAPAGVFALGPAFGSASAADTSMPYLVTEHKLVCVDDVRSDAYNQIVTLGASPTPRSFERMVRDDGLYRLGLVVQHNPHARSGLGSCIFLHIWRAAGSGTSGCTAMAAPDLKMLLQWLNPDANPLLIQIPLHSMHEVQKRFNGLGE